MASMGGKVCPKCGYKREPRDLAPETECPRCGVLYLKAERSSHTAVPGGEAGLSPPEPSLTDRLAQQKEGEMEKTKGHDLAFSGAAALFLGFCFNLLFWKFLDSAVFLGRLQSRWANMSTPLFLKFLIGWSFLFGVISWPFLYRHRRKQRMSWWN